MDPVGSLIVVLIATAALAALCGYIGGTVRQRGRRSARGYFALGILAGVIGVTVLRRRLGHLGTLALITRNPIRRRGPDNRFAGVASHVLRTVSRAHLTR